MSEPWTPREYQETALEWGLSREAAGLMLDPGLGKTSTMLALYSILKEKGEVRRALVVAPLRVAKTVWPVEAKKWLDFNHLKVVHLCEMTDDQREQLMLDPATDIFVINPESLHKVLNPRLFLLGNFDVLVIDESTKFKDAQTQRFKALKPMLKYFKRRYCLTGTPRPNGAEDLFGQVYILDYGKRLGRYITHFRQAYMVADYMGYNYTMRPGAEDQIYEKVSDILLRQKAVDHLDMPELIFNYIDIELPAAARKHYKEVEDQFLTALADETVVAFNAASAGTKCRQISNGFLYSQEVQGEYHHIHNEKLDALEELVEEMQGRPLLVFYEYIADRKMIQDRFPRARDINDGKVEDNIIAFNEGKISMMIAHPASAGHGLNLQESCSTICWYGVTWNLEHYLQANARVWRQGQKANQVVVHHIVAKDTLDQRVIRTLAQKDAAQEKLSTYLISLAKQRAPQS